MFTKNTLLKTTYFSTFVLCLFAGAASLYLSYVAITMTFTQRLDVLQWGGALIPLGLAAIILLPVSLLNLKTLQLLKSHGARFTQLMVYGKKIVIALMLSLAVAYGLSMTIALVRLNILHS